MVDIRVQEYIDLCRKGDKKAFEYIVSEYQKLVYVLSFRLLCNEDDAEDITQEVFIKVWQKLSSYNHHYRFSTWIYKITCNACYDKLRSEQHTRKVSLTDFDICSDANVDDSTHNAELRTLILKVTEELTPKQKLVFTLCEIEESER